MKVRKELAGSDSYGNTWESDGVVIDIPEEQARDLVSIADGGFSLVEPPTDDGDAGGDGEDHPDDSTAEDESGDEGTDRAVDEAPHPAARRGRPRKGIVEE